MKTAVFTLLFISIFVFTPVVNAQFNQIETAVNVEMIPQNPGPNEQVIVSVVSYGTDINSATITWRINGKTQKTGKGEKTFSFKVGEINTTTTLDITIVTKEGETITRNLRIRPTGIDLIWQADSFVPPLYKGKTLFSHQNKITFIAMPHITNSAGVEISAKNLIYKWIKNGTVMDSDSGYGKNTYSFVGSLISRPLEIEVEVTSPNTSGSGTAVVTVNPVDPSVILYRKSPIYGIEFQKALQNTVEMIDSKEISVIGIPFFFGTENVTSEELDYKWSINGMSIDNSSNQPIQIFRQKEGTSGISKISLSIENTKKILQLTSNSFSLKFGNNTSQ